MFTSLSHIPHIADSEDPELREAVDSVLMTILVDGAFGILNLVHSVLEVRGSTTMRLRMIDDAISTRSANM